jgi:hypothetical protein
VAQEAGGWCLRSLARQPRPRLSPHADGLYYIVRFRIFYKQAPYILDRYWICRCKRSSHTSPRYSFIKFKLQHKPTDKL